MLLDIMMEQIRSLAEQTSLVQTLTIQLAEVELAAAQQESMQAETMEDLRVELLTSSWKRIPLHSLLTAAVLQLLIKVLTVEMQEVLQPVHKAHTGAAFTKVSLGVLLLPRMAVVAAEVLVVLGRLAAIVAAVMAVMA